MVKKKSSLKHTKKRVFLRLPFIILGFLTVSFTLFLLLFFLIEEKYKDRIYPGVRVDNIGFGGKSIDDVISYFDKKSKSLDNISFSLVFEDKIATISAVELELSFDGKLYGTQAYLAGRSGYIFSDLLQKWKLLHGGTNISSSIKINTDNLDNRLKQLSDNIYIPYEDALFQFENGKVNIFKTGSPGRELDVSQTKNLIMVYIKELNRRDTCDTQNFLVDLPVNTVKPKITTENSNSYGIKELLGKGNSTFFHSIPGRVHNVELAASRIHGRLIAPDEIFSFNNALGDVSSSTGFQQAYIIQNGRTVLGDGGGVCQVSTTLFRAVLNAGLPVIERKAHAYRVGYYEQGFPPGIDATVFAPSPDFKFKNDTGNYILIQEKIDTANYFLSFEIYGTNDGRIASITKPTLYGQIPPPPDVYQDDPTLQKGVVKQVDWSAWGGKTSFDYIVKRNGEEVNKQTFFSNFQPWRNIYLRGTKE